jgi:hypothetical protein
MPNDSRLSEPTLPVSWEGSYNDYDVRVVIVDNPGADARAGESITMCGISVEWIFRFAWRMLHSRCYANEDHVNTVTSAAVMALAQ